MAHSIYVDLATKLRVVIMITYSKYALKLILHIIILPTDLNEYTVVIHSVVLRTIINLSKYIAH